MKIPIGLAPLIEEGAIDEVIRPLRSGKEASIYVVRCGSELRCAKVYKDLGQRSFQQRAQYQEGRRVRSSRQARAMGQRTRFGRKAQETAWKTAEVDALNLLTEVGVRVPTPYGFFNGVLLMELVTDAEGLVAPDLGEVEHSPQQATHSCDQAYAPPPGERQTSLRNRFLREYQKVHAQHAALEPRPYRNQER